MPQSESASASLRPLLGGRRGATVASLLLIVGGGLTLLAFGRPWAQVVVSLGAGGPGLARSWSGGELIPWATPLGVVLMAGVVGLLALRGIARRGLGVLLVLAALPLVWVSLRVGLFDDAPLGPVCDANNLPASVCSGSEAGGTSGPLVVADLGAWWVLALIAALIGAVGALLLVVRSADWPALGARYERTGRTTGPTPTGAPPTATSATDVWKALDRGEDPTA